MFFILSKLFDVFLEPLAWVLVALIVIAVRVRPRSRAELKTKKLVFLTPLVTFVVLSVLSMRPVSNALTRTLESAAPTTMRDGVTYDAVIVLTGMVDLQATSTHGEVSLNDNVERIVVAVDLLREGRAKNVLISGASEAPVLADMIVRWGIARERIVLEERALNTHENAVYSARVVRERGWGSLLLVTSAFHMKRSIGCFRATGLAFDTRPVDWRAYGPPQRSTLLPRTDALEESTAAIREHSGWLVYRIQGYAVP